MSANEEADPHQSRGERAKDPLQFDAYGLKNLRPAEHLRPLAKPAAEGFLAGFEGVDDDPKSLRELGRSVYQSLLRLIAGAFALPGDALRSTRRVLGGLGSVLPALARRLSGAHAEAERAEVAKQQQAMTPALTVIEPRDSVAALLDFRDELRARGIPCDIERVHGSWVIGIVQVEHAALATEGARQLLEDVGVPAGLLTADATPAPPPETPPPARVITPEVLVVVGDASVEAKAVVEVKEDAVKTEAVRVSDLRQQAAASEATARPPLVIPEQRVQEATLGAETSVTHKKPEERALE